MNREQRIQEIAALRDELAGKVIPHARDQYERDACLKIVDLLKGMEAEYASGRLRPKDRRYGYVGRLVAETDPDILPPELGGRLMQAERRYIDEP